MEWTYRLNPALVLQRGPGGGALVSFAPPAVYRLSPGALRLLALCDGRHTVAEIARAVPSEPPGRLRAVLEGLADRQILLRELPARPGPGGPIDGNGDWPTVSVIVPVRNRPEALRQCLASLRAVRYPPDRLEVLVVDDASTDETPDVARAAGARLLVLPEPSGQSACRNAGARAARGEILAFTDSDCVVSERWLVDLVGAFADPEVAIVGGLVEGTEGNGVLERYETVFSPLFMGRRVAELGPGRPVGYVPTCNALVRRADFLAVGGFREDLRVGEDVDLCWRLLREGRRGWYLPAGAVEHRHRTRLWPFLVRRAQYATSESWLEAHHVPARKRLVLLRWPLVHLALLLCLPGLGLRPFLGALLAACLVHFLDRLLTFRRLGSPSPRFALRAQLRDHLAFWGTLSALASRYYLLPLLLAGTVWSPCLWAAGLALGVSGFLEYRGRRPRLDIARVLAVRFLEMLAYQLGVYYGCIRHRNHTPVLPRLRLV